MPLRLVEITLPSDQASELRDVLQAVPAGASCEESVHDGQGVVKFERFSLQERTVRQERNEPFIEDLYTTSMVVAVGKLTLVVAAQEPTSKRALFLALQVEPR